MNSKLQMPELQNTNRGVGVYKAQYCKDELQLRQPKGFPIIPLPSTVARAREEAEAEAAVRPNSKLEFDIYEDAGHQEKKVPADDTAEEINGEAREISGEKDGNDFSGESAQLEKEGREALPSFTSAAETTHKSSAPVDSHGRTRAAANRRKALGSIQLENSHEGLVGKEDDKASNGKKRRSDRTQVSRQAKKRSVRKSG